MKQNLFFRRIYMTDFKEALIVEWKKERDILNGLDVKKDGEAYERQMKRIADLERNIVDLDKNRMDNAAKFTLSKDEEKNSKMRFVGDLIKTSIPVVGAFTMGLISMRWEKVDTLTTSAGKSSLRDALKFK